MYPTELQVWVIKNIIFITQRVIFITQRVKISHVIFEKPKPKIVWVGNVIEGF